MEYGKRYCSYPLKVGDPSHLNLNFKKYRLFVRLKFYHLKKIEQTDGGLARRQNNGDNKPFSENRCIIIIFPRMNALFTEDIWERTHYDRDGKILLVRSIERFFCFRPLAFATRINHLLKTVDHTPHTSLWPSVSNAAITSVLSWYWMWFIMQMRFDS